ncbi:MAG: TolC family protein [Chlamydiales bacterium]|nr:TolC family protein [Chlamydiales bacterium]
MKRLLLLLLLFTSTLGADSLDLKQCQMIAIDSNPLSRAATYGIKAAYEGVGVARAPYYPNLKLDAHYTRWQIHNFLKFNVPPALAGLISPYEINPEYIGPTNDYGITLSSRYTIYDCGERNARLMSALAEQGQACEEAERIRQQILLNVSLAYYNLISHHELQQVAKSNLERTEKHRKIAEERKEVGAVPLADVYRAQVNAAEAKQELVHANNLVRISQGNLSTSMGLPPDTELSILAESPDYFSPETISLKKAQKNATKIRPEIRALEKQLCALRYKIKEAGSQFGPRMEAEGVYGKRDSDFFPGDDEWVVGVSVSMPIFTGYGLDHSLRRVKAEYCRIQAHYDSLTLNVQQEVWKAYSTLNEAYEMILTSVAQVEDASESNRLAEERYQAGAGTITDLLDAQTALARAEATHVEALWSFRAALTVFQWTQGLLEPE